MLNSATLSNLTRQLSCMSLNAEQANPPCEYNHIFLGIGLWSAIEHLTTGLPVDVMPMLLSATLQRAKILCQKPETESKLIILIADSMAVAEGAAVEEVALRVEQYQQALLSLLELLNMLPHTEIILSSQLIEDSNYQEMLKEIEAHEVSTQLQIHDALHYRYIVTQVTITEYLHRYAQVGTKVGWIDKKSTPSLLTSNSAEGIPNWNELKFDLYYKKMFPESQMVFLYTQAGIKFKSQGRDAVIEEACPYTAFPSWKRYLVLAEQPTQRVKEVFPVNKGVARKWKDVITACENLKGTCPGLLPNVLPEDYVHAQNDVVNTEKVLDYWVNHKTSSSVSRKI